jgi:hypothetical protein
MERQKVYCEIGFIKRFMELSPNHESYDVSENEKSIIWKNYLKFIFNSNIFLNISSLELKEHFESGNGIVKQLVKNWSNGNESLLECKKMNFVINNDLDKQLENDNVYFNSTLLLDQPISICNSIRNNYGLQVISPEEIFSNSKIFVEFKKSVKKDEFYLSMWNVLKDFKYPCNALSIIDNYVLLDDKIIKKNLIQILEYLLPKSLKIPFHISIFTLKEPNSKILNFENKKKFIESEIKFIRPNLKFKLSIFCLQDKTEHDRSLITNYLQIDSGSGFDLHGTNNKTTHKTTLNISFPITATYISDNSDNVTENLRMTMKKIFSNSSDSVLAKNYWGDKENRLFEY